MADNPKSIATYALDGSELDFTIPFEYLARKFIVVTLLGDDVIPDRVLVLTDDYRFTAPTQVTLNQLWGPADGYNLIEIRRYTSATERLVNFSDGSILRSYDLNTSQIQSLHIAEEARDVSSQALLKDLVSWDAAGLRIRNLANPVLNQDAATKKYVDDTSDADISYVDSQIDRTIRSPSGEILAVMPNAASRANKVMGFDAQGNPNVMLPSTGSGSEVAADLANPLHGAKMVAYDDKVAPAYLKTLSDIANAEKVSIMRFIPVPQHAALYSGTSVTDFTANFQEAFMAFDQGGELTLPPVTFNTMGLEIVTARDFKISGAGWKSRIKNNSITGKHAIYVRGDTIDDRTYGLDIESLTLEGNPLSGDGLRLDRLGWYDGAGRQASVTNLNKIQVLNNGKNGVQVGRSATEGAGNSVNLIGSFISGNLRTGVVGIGQTNMISLLASAVTKNGVDGVELNQVASTNTVSQTFIADNARYGVFAFRCEQPMICHNGFNRNMQGAVAFSGDPTGSIKYTEAGLIFANLFGDNGRDAAIGREISIYASKGTNILANYFYGTGQETMIYLSDYAEGVMIAGNHFKDLTTEVKLEIKSGATNLAYTFDDDVGGSTVRQIMSNKLTQYIIPANSGLFQTRGDAADSAPRFLMNGDGTMSFSGGTSAADVTLSRAVAGSLRVSGGFQAQTLGVASSVAVPAAMTGFVRIFMDSTDGLLKFRLPSGVVRTFTVT